MSLLSSKLDKLEASLQILIEGRLARLFPAFEYRDEIIQCLEAAMKSGIQNLKDGSSLAPDTYIILVHPTLAERIDKNQNLLNELSSIILEGGTSAGFLFSQPPNVSISTNADVEQSFIEVVARINQDGIGETVESVVDLDSEVNNIPENAFLIVNSELIFPLNKSLINVGRRANNDLVIDDARVSRTHIQLRAIRGHFLLSDLDSKGGTFINGQRVTQRILTPQDVISLAGVPLIFSQDDAVLGKTQQIIARSHSVNSEDRTKDTIL